MSQLVAADPPALGLGRPLCPNCQGTLTAKLICWGCCDRLCGGCGQLTGSAFLELCWPCSFRASADETSEGQHPEEAGSRH